MAAAAHGITGAREARGGFYVIMAVLCAVIAYSGFAPTYWVPLATGRLDTSPLVHLHALFFFGWMLLFLAQTLLVARGRGRTHRELGVAGVAVATGMVFTGVLMAMRSLETGYAAGYGEAARSFSIVSFSAITLFAMLVTAALLCIRTRPDYHKRLMLLATISLLQAAVGRLFMVVLREPGVLPDPGALGPPPVFVTVAPGLLTDLLIIAAIVHDWRSRGRPHPALLIGGLAVVAVQVLRIPIANTATWHAFAALLVR